MDSETKDIEKKSTQDEIHVETRDENNTSQDLHQNTTNEVETNKLHEQTVHSQTSENSLKDTEPLTTTCSIAEPLIHTDNKVTDSDHNHNIHKEVESVTNHQTNHETKETVSIKTNSDEVNVQDIKETGHINEDKKEVDSDTNHNQTNHETKETVSTKTNPDEVNVQDIKETGSINEDKEVDSDTNHNQTNHETKETVSIKTDEVNVQDIKETGSTNEDKKENNERDNQNNTEMKIESQDNVNNENHITHETTPEPEKEPKPQDTPSETETPISTFPEEIKTQKPQKSRSLDTSSDSVKKVPSHVTVRPKFFNSHGRTRNGYRATIEKMKNVQARQLAVFRKHANNNEWDEIHHDHYDWFMFPIEDGSQSQYNVLSEDVKDLLNDETWHAGYREAVTLVAKAWGWDVEKQAPVDPKHESMGWTGWDVRLAKIIRSLWIFGQDDFKESMQKFAWKVKPHGNLRYGYICLDEVLYM
jgi:hypothetical protein